MLSLAAGAALAPATLSGEPAKFLGTFLGLVSASILPTVSLILATMAPGGRSVLALDALQKELESAMDALFTLLLSVGMVFAALFALSVPTPSALLEMSHLTNQILPRIGQSAVLGGTALIVMRAWHVPAILRRSLKIRHQIAVDEARKKTIENASRVVPEELFPRDPEFGKTVKISDLPSH